MLQLNIEGGGVIGVIVVDVLAVRVVSFVWSEHRISIKKNRFGL